MLIGIDYQLKYHGPLMFRKVTITQTGPQRLPSDQDQASTCSLQRIHSSSVALGIPLRPTHAKVTTPGALLTHSPAFFMEEGSRLNRHSGTFPAASAA
jgi:hypothetical protein